MTSEALALFDAAQASAPNAGARKRNRPEEDGAAPDFAAMLAQLQPGAMGFQRADISLAVPQRAETPSTPAAQPTDQPRGRDEQALSGDGRGADDSAEAAGRGRDQDRTQPREAAAPRTDTRASDAAARPAQAPSTAPDTAEARPAQQAQANTQPAANAQAARAAAEAGMRPDGTIQAASGNAEGVQPGQAQAQAQQTARATGPDRVQVNVSDAQDGAVAPNAQTASAAAALTAQAHKPTRTGAEGASTADALVPDASGDGSSALLQGQAQAAAARNQAAGRNGEGMTRDGQGANQSAQAQMQAQAGVGAAANGNLPQPANFQATLAASNSSGAASATQPVHTLGGESLTSTAAATGQAGSTTGRAGLAAQTPARPNLPTPPSEQVAVQIQRAVGQGADRISIQLNPEELGRIEVKLEMKDGRMTAMISADRQETLDMLQRDARGLIQTLQNAGLQTDQGSLSFNLRGGDAQAQNQQPGQGGNTPWSPFGDDGAEARPAAPAFTPPQDLARAGADGRLDVRV